MPRPAAGQSRAWAHCAGTVRGTRLAIHKTLDLPLHDAEILAETFRERVVRTEDAVEGPKAFMEKRAPNWQCR